MAPHEVTFTDVMDFFKTCWAPAVESLHSKKGGIIGDFLAIVLESVKELPTNEVSIFICNLVHAYNTSEPENIVYYLL